MLTCRPWLRACLSSVRYCIMLCYCLRTCVWRACGPSAVRVWVCVYVCMWIYVYTKDAHTNNTNHKIYTSSEDKMAEKSDKDGRYATWEIQKRTHTTVTNKEDTNDDEETNMIRNEVQTKIKLKLWNSEIIKLWNFEILKLGIFKFLNFLFLIFLIFENLKCLNGENCELVNLWFFEHLNFWNFEIFWNVEKLISFEFFFVLSIWNSNKFWNFKKIEI